MKEGTDDDRLLRVDLSFPFVTLAETEHCLVQGGLSLELRRLILLFDDLRNESLLFTNWLMFPLRSLARLVI